MPRPPAPPIALNALEMGSGTPLVLLHGLGGDHTVWNSVIPDLARAYRVRALDLRGHGRSPGPDGSTFGFDELVGDLGADLDRAGLAAVHLVGMSAGGYLALRFALDHPEQVRSLTLIGSGLYCDRHTRAIGERWAETLRDEGYDAYLLRLMKDLYYPDWAEAHLDTLDALRESWRTVDLGGVVRWGLAVREFDERPRVARLRAPTLAIHGMDDQVVDVSHARLLRQSIAGCDVRLLAQTGHMVPIERPAETAEAIRSLVEKVTGSGSAPTTDTPPERRPG